MTARKALPWLAGLVLAAAAVAGGYFLLRTMNRAEDAGHRHEARLFARANTICGAPPARITTHNAGWSFGPWIEVFCTDGSTRAIRL